MAQPNVENTLLDNLNYESEDMLFYGVNLLDEKEFSLFIKKTEFLARKSQEYTQWALRTKQYASKQNSDPERDDSSQCPICDIAYQFAQAESHHHPVTLFNLCIKHFQRWVDDNCFAEKTALDLVQEVMADHLIGRVEHVVLCKHCHEKYHNGERNITDELDKIIKFKRDRDREPMPDTVKQKFEEINRLRELDWAQKNERRRNVYINEHSTEIDPDKIKVELLNFINNTNIII